MDAGWSEERVKSLLVQLEPQAVRTQGWLLGAQMGTLLKALDPTFHPRVLGDSNLKRLLARFPEVGAVEPLQGSVDFRFRFNGIRSKVSDASSTQQHTVEGLLWVDQQLWLGLTLRNSTERRYIDLQTRRVVAVRLNQEGEPSEPVKDEPDRYLAVPVLSLEELKPVAVAFAEKVTQAELREALLRSASLENWFPAFLKTLEPTGLLEQWKVARQIWVAQRARQWLAHHHLPVEPFIRTRAARPSAPQMASPAVSRTSSPGLARGSLRQVVLRAVARMSDEELLSLSIPLRYLLAEEADSGQ